MSRRMGVAWGFVVLLMTGCSGPKLLLVPGGALEGTVASGAVEEWGSGDSWGRVQLETRPDAPYSVHVFGVGSCEAFYVASQGWRASVGGGPGNARWVPYIEADPRVRLRVGSWVYERKAVRVTDEAELAHVQAAFQTKYGDDAENWGFWLGEDDPPWVYRLDPR